MKRIILISIWLSLSSVVFMGEAKPIFGVKVCYQSTGQFTSFMVYLDNGVTQNARKILTQNEFIHIASGKWPSMYNPKRINYFEEHNLNCGVIKDSITLKEYGYCLPLDSLWKIRFQKHPFDISQGNGWSQKQFRPSPHQEIYLYDNYKIKQIDGDYFLGDNFWKILQDIQNPEWIENYKAIQ